MIPKVRQVCVMSLWLLNFIIGKLIKGGCLNMSRVQKGKLIITICWRRCFITGQKQLTIIPYVFNFHVAFELRIQIKFKFLILGYLVSD